MAASEVAVDAAVYYRLRGTLEADLGARLIRVARALSLNLDTPILAQFRAGDEALGAYTLLRQRLARDVDANGLGRAYVFDRDLRTIIDSRDGVAVGTTRYELMPQRARTERAWSGTASPTPIYLNEDGVLRLTALVPIRNADDSVFALLGVDASPEFFDVLSGLRRQMLLLGAASLAVAGLGGLVLIRGASERLTRVRETVARASQGDFTASQETRRADQLGGLERDLDQLLESMVARVDYYESLLASVHIGLLAVDLDGRIVGANLAATRWLSAPGAVPGQTIVGRGLLDALGFDADLHGLARDVVDGVTDGLTREVTPQSGGAAGFTLAAVVSPLMQSGRHTGATLSLSDVTVLRTLERQAQAQERLASLGTMAGGLLHEVRSPLASVMMHLDLLRPSVTDQEGLEVLAQATESTERLSRFLVDFQIVAGLRPLRRDWFDFQEAVEAVIEGVPFPPGVDVRMTSGGSAVVHADRGLLEHAVRNVLVNAAEAVQPGTGIVRIQCDRVDHEVVLTVADNGAGLSKTNIERVFDPMFTTKRTGTGLGLTIVTRVVSAHGGSTLVTNGAHGGAVFTIRWPLGEQR